MGRNLFILRSIFNSEVGPNVILRGGQLGNIIIIRIKDLFRSKLQDIIEYSYINIYWNLQPSQYRDYNCRGGIGYNG